MIGGLCWQTSRRGDNWLHSVCRGLAVLVWASRMKADSGNLLVPKGSISLEHTDYVADAWTAGSMPDFIMALPDSKELGESKGTPEKLRSFQRMNHDIMAIELAGTRSRALMAAAPT